MIWESLNAEEREKYKGILTTQINKENAEYKELYPFEVTNQDIFENQKLLDHFCFESETLADFFSQMLAHDTVIKDDSGSFPNILWDNCKTNTCNKNLTAQTVFKGIGIPFSLIQSESEYDKILVKVDFCTIKSETLIDKSTFSLDLHIRTSIWPKIASWAGRIKLDNLK
ncbi:unnamed protein product [Oikopleura dioica]|uniref:Uncharacterized protein n=1 Tax=Oikopleura dioica TaxID=34765 RepID=E4WUT1_OIKDI|nr:unnamed protein product [Oikopleura dioica]CBY21615.1 unnamed protein product [Oikopleura dioica]CBY34361.1 unnamed protein product [Oikopleura dioica]